MRSAYLSFFAFGLGLAACGGTSSTLAPSDGGPSGVDVNACLPTEPAEGAACVAGQSVCETGDPCCRGYIFVCTGGSWTKEGLGCACPRPIDSGADAPADAPSDVQVPEDAPADAPSDAPDDVERADAGPFACGPMTTCSAAQFCTDQPPGVHVPDGSPGPDAFWCTAIPGACVATPTCACVKAQVGASCTVYQCDDDGAGHVTVHCLGV
jgi:hypothetical protein